MSLINFKEIAKYCVEEYKREAEANPDSSQYMSTVYVCIDRYNEILCSNTPHILEDAEKCILIHSKKTLAITNWYLWYQVNYINSEGCVLGNDLGRGFKLTTNYQGSFANQVMSLCYEDITLYTCPCCSPWEEKLSRIWELYLRARKCESKQSIELLAEIIEKDETILENQEEIKNFKFSNYILEQKNKQYRRLLREIRELVEHNNNG